MKKIAILGSTGSIGRQTLDVVRLHSDKFCVVCLTAFSNIALIEAQAAEFQPQFVGTVQGESSGIYTGQDAFEKVLDYDFDILVAASNGLTALPVVIEALKRGKRVALANKETLVAGGELICGIPERRNLLIPVDSEHSAIFQCLLGSSGKGVKRLILTASGGPFFGKSKNFLQCVSPQQALKHPSWSMGAKITIDSATMMNKGLEIIEACRLFDVDESEIDVVVHPQSIVHSMVEFVDGSVIAQLSNPDMKLPIQFALSFPERLQGSVSPLALAGQSLTFAEAGENKPMALCREAVRRGGLYPAVLTAANDVCVKNFLQHKIGFLDIENIVENVLQTYDIGDNILTLDSVMQTQCAAGALAESFCGKVMRKYK